jgi:class 3 adenylate cyclase
MDCPRCRHPNRENARFCGACGAALQEGVHCPRCATFNPLGQKFCDSCGERLGADEPTAGGRNPRDYTPRHLVERVLNTRSAMQGERKQVTVLFVDLVDSMGLAEKVGAERWHGVLDRFFQILGEGVHGFEGTINQFTGDGIMALFGAPVAHEDHARRACHAALRLKDDLRSFARTLEPSGLRLAVRMGLNSGEVVVGKIGDDLRMDYTAQGHSVGLAARLQSAAAPGAMLMTEETARLVEGFFTLHDRGTTSVKGVSGQTRIFELAGVGPLRTRLDASAARGFSRLVAREGELAWLAAILARTRESHGQVVGIVADAGVGKSRLCFEFVTRLRERGVAVHEAHCPAHGSTVPLMPVRELVRSLFDVVDGDLPDQIRQKLSDQLLALDRGFAEALPLMLALLGVESEDAEPTAHTQSAALGRAEGRQRLATFLRRFIRTRGAREPVVLLVDDAHWIDAASDEVIRELVSSVPGTRTLVLANFRPEYRPSWIGGAHYHQLSLSPLSEEACRELLIELLGPDPSVRTLADQICERTGGNPFFVEEVVRALAGSGALEGNRGAYRAAAFADALGLPATVQALLAARVDRLGEAAKQTLQTAAVIGKEFDEPLLAAVAGLAADALSSALESLQEAEFVHLLSPYPQPRYAFKHPLTREVAYQSQLADARSRAHAVVAAALEKLRSDRLGEYAALIAHHWDASGMRFEAARWQRRAALRVSNIKIKSRGSRRR